MASRILAGRYELIEKIGEGGMAVVFKGRDRLLNRLVAIKILRPEYTKDSVFIDSFVKESQIAAGLVHPNIVNIYDVGKQGNIYYIIMELIQGKPLSEIIEEEGALEPRRAVKIAKEIASALSTAHKNNLIHRDVKPHNIMITTDGVAKITDFGIAKTLPKDTLVGENKEAVMGSVHYFSPEQARGGYVDARSDIYSLGIVLYEMITGQVPYDGETAVEVAVKHMNEEMKAPSSINPNVPDDVEKIIFKAADKLQVNRYKNADEMIMALNLVKFSRIHAEAAEEPVAKSAEDEEDQQEKPVRHFFGGHASSKQEEEPEEDDDDEQPHYSIAHPRPWVKTVIAICLAILLALPVADFIAKKTLANKESVPDSLELPNLVNVDFNEAQEQLAEFGIELKIQMPLFSDEYEVNRIMSQSPSEGTVLKRGSTVNVSVSKGIQATSVPDVVGKTYASARYSIESYNYKLGSVSYEYSDKVETNFVISQNPEGGTNAAAGKAVDLVISKGKGDFNFVGLSEEESKAKIKDQGCNYNNTIYEYNEDVEAGMVYAQSPKADKVKTGDNITITVSKGVNPDKIKPSDEKDDDPQADNPVTDPQNPGQENQGTEQNPGENKPETPQYEIKSVVIPVDLSNAAEEQFILMVTTTDGYDDARTTQEDVDRREGVKMLSVSGRGTHGTVIIRFGNQIVNTYSVNFETGTVL